MTPVIAGGLSGLPGPVRKGIRWLDQHWSIRALPAECRRKPAERWALPFKKVERVPMIRALMEQDLSRTLPNWFAISSGQYYAGVLPLNAHLTQRIFRFFPGVFHGRPQDFGFMHDTFKAFFAPIRGHTVDEVIDPKHWRVIG